jgi:hypothetical protein
MNMNLNSLAIPGIKLTELPAFLKKNGIEGEEVRNGGLITHRVAN